MAAMIVVVARSTSITTTVLPADVSAGTSCGK